MDKRRAAGRGPRGGRSIPEIRAESAYLVTGAGSCALVVGITLRVAETPGPVQLVFAAAGAVGVAMLIAAIASGYGILAYWAVGFVAAAYVASVVVAGPPDQWSIATAVALLLSAELASWSIDSRRRGRDDLAAHAARLRTIVLVSVVAFVLALLTQDAAIFGPGGTATAAVAVVAVVAAIVALGMMLWRSINPAPKSGPE